MRGKIAGKLKVMFFVSVVIFTVMGVISLVASEDISSAADNEQIVFSEESGCYDSGFWLTLEAPGGGDIYYTLDASVPKPGNPSTRKYTGAFMVSDNKGSNPVLTTDENSSKFTENGWANVPWASALDRASIVRAVVVAADGTVVSPVSTRTYFINNDIVSAYGGCAVMSIVTDPKNLLNSESGIYVLGSRYENSAKTDEDFGNLVNFMQSGGDWERPAHMEFFDGSAKASVSRGVGIRIHGGYSRRNQQKSFKIYFRDKYDYGVKNLSGYDLIPGATVTYDSALAGGATRATSDYSNVILRNGGNDVDETKFQDVFIQSMVTDRKFTTQASRPCMLYLNGEYWGLYNLTEKYSDNYLAEEFDVNKDNVIVYKDLEIDEGANLDPQGSELAGLMGLGELDMTKPENYNKFLSTVDADSYIDYYATQIYINNNDWWSGCNADSPHNNLMFWKVANSALENPDNPYADGKWRYMLFDTEWSMGIYNSEQASAEYDSIKYHAMGEPDPFNDADWGRMEPNGDPVFRAVFKNASFREKFTNTLLDLRNWNFEYERCSEELTKIRNTYESLMNKNSDRWRVGDIEGGIERMQYFLMLRPDYILTILEDNIPELTMSDRVNVTVTNSANKQYAVGVNSILPDSSGGFRGVYYKDYPITVSAKDMEGYTFDHWEVTGGTVSDDKSPDAEITFTDSYATINAVYTGGDDTENDFDIGTYYVSEFAVPFAGQKNAGDSVGFEVQVNDCGPKRYGTLNLFSETSSCDSGEQFGRLILSEQESDSIINDNSLKVKKTTSHISLDGVIDDAWEEAEYVTLEYYHNAYDDSSPYICSAKAKFLWDDSKLYVLVVTDDERISHNFVGEESDSVEIFYDEDAANPAGYTDDMFQFRLLHNGITENGKGNPGAYNVESGVRVYDGEEKNGYITEFAVPFKELKSSGDRVSFELQVADAVSGADVRIGKLNLFVNSSVSPYNDRSKFGYVRLSDGYQPKGEDFAYNELYAVKTDTAITADGVMEEAWQKTVPYVIETYTRKEIDGYDISVKATVRLMWDSSNLYVLVRVIDNDLKSNVKPEDSDCVELFFDESVDENTVNSPDYVTAFQYRVTYDGIVEPGKNYDNAGHSVMAASRVTKKAEPTPTPTPEPTPVPEPTPTPVPTEVPEPFIATFNAKDATVTTYLRQNYDAADETFVNQDTAAVRNSDTGYIDISGDGQVNFTIVPKEGYSVESVSVSPQENYKNIKPPMETGKENTYRVTKITGDITINITTKPTEQTGGNKNEFTATFDTGANCSITTYNTQDYNNAGFTHVNQTSAVARNYITGEPDVTGDGQINFTVIPDAGYAVKEVVVTPKNYKNIKMPVDTGKADTYRITKIIGDITVKITLEKLANPVVTPPPSSTDEPGATENPGSTQEPGDNAPRATDIPAPTDGVHEPITTPTPDKGDASGKEFTYGNLRYIVSGKTAIVTGVVKKNVTAVNIPASVKWNGTSVKVLKVSDRAFKNCKKLRSVIIGKNVKSLGKDSFRGCPKLAKLVVKSGALTKIGKSAFVKTAGNMKIYVPKSRYAKYSKKVFKGKGLSGLVKFYKR